MQFADEHGIMIIDECALSQTNVAIEYTVLKVRLAYSSLLNYFIFVEATRKNYFKIINPIWSS